MNIRIGLTASVVTLLMAGTAHAAVNLPADGSPLNIDPNQSAGVSDVVGGSLAAGGARVPWATFEQHQTDGSQQIFVRAFKGGKWVTQGPSLNISPNVEAEGPSIDFAGAGRTVPWDTWYEPNAALGGTKQIFASRFNAAANTWQPEGQDRGAGVPSLNIHTDKEAEDPNVVGGATVAGNDPVPWVSWEEQDGAANTSQIFVSKGVKQAAPNSPCTNFKPSSANSVSNFCWQQVGKDRLAKDGGSDPAGDPSLNIDPTRNGVEPDAAFTGAGDTVDWTVWYEKDNSGLGLNNNEQVFAARLVADPTADGGFSWRPVGNGTAGTVQTLDTSGANGFGSCAASTAAENACSLNKNPAADAEDPRVAAGTLVAGTPTVPWVTWSENDQIFVSRLVGGDHFELFNGGNPIGAGTQPDITFFGNTPYVTYTQNGLGFVGHFDATGAFILDTPGGINLNTSNRGRGHGGALSLIDARVAISSSCTADPFTADGKTCTPGDVNSPFTTFTAAGTPQRLFSQAVIGGPNCVLFAGCKVQIPVQGNGATIDATLRTPCQIGILVEKPDGRRVGRVPLGKHGKGRVHIHWDLKVAGKKLHHGRYRITLRALDKHGNVLGLTKPVNVRV